MGKTAFIFPGQGSQYTGMGQDFYEAYPECREVFEIAQKASGLDLKKLIFEPNEDLHITKYTQVAMLTVELAILRVVKSLKITADLTAGLSLGEYGALVAAGVLSEKDALQLVTERGRLMQEAVPTGGAMAAIMATPAELIEEVCENTEGIVSIANYNCPGQIVITGEADAVANAQKTLLEKGAKRCIPLKVSGPFHSAMLNEAGEKLAKEIDKVTIQDPIIPYISNVTAQAVTGKQDVKGLLQKQIASSVRWQQSVEAMIEDGVDRFIELGPKKTLSGFLKKIDRNVTAISIEKVEDLEQLK